MFVGQATPHCLYNSPACNEEFKKGGREGGRGGEGRGGREGREGREGGRGGGGGGREGGREGGGGGEEGREGRWEGGRVGGSDPIFGSHNILESLSVKEGIVIVNVDDYVAFESEGEVQS